MKLRNFIAVISCLVVVTGCQSLGTPGGAEPLASPATAHDAYPNSPVAAHPLARSGVSGAYFGRGNPTEAPDDLWLRIGSGLSWQDIHHQRVDKAVAGYLSQPGYLPTVSQRGSLYLYYIVEEVNRRNMPMEIVLVPFVESTLDPFAYSPGKAAGLWQIMPATGRHLGLQQNWWFDGRRAVRDSTRAALDYLERLHADFDQDWLLALAAYNAGEGRVARARRANLRKGLPTDYWSLDLPRETRRYVPRVLALSRILADPQAHGVEIPRIANEPAFEVASLDGQIELARAATLADVSPDTLRYLNPGHLRWATADGLEELLLPVGSSERFEQALAKLPPDQRISWHHYTIRPGDSLIAIGRKFHTDVSVLRRVNGITGSYIRAGSSLMIPGGDPGSGVALVGRRGTPAIGYKVRRGDSLARIAGKYKITVADIVAWNALDPQKYLQPGQTLKLHVRGS